MRQYEDRPSQFNLIEERINHNVALHLVTDLNKRLLIFPWAPL